MAMKILLATDGSNTARAAVDFVLKFPFPTGTQVTVMTVIREVLHSRGADFRGMDRQVDTRKT